jgi:AraC-like DNA-binding protein
VEANQGDVIMVNPGEIHDGAPIGKQLRVWQMIYFDPAVLVNELEGETISSIEFVRPVLSDAQLARHFDRLFCSLANGIGDGLRHEERTVEMLEYLLRRHTVCRLHKASAPCLAKARERMDSAPETRVTLRELAASCGLSRFQFLRAFSAAFGITPHAYQMQRRTQTAKILLSRGLTPAEAAAQAGFADQSHLTRSFVRQYGMTPGRYASAIR